MKIELPAINVYGIANVLRDWHHKIPAGLRNSKINVVLDWADFLEMQYNNWIRERTDEMMGEVSTTLSESLEQSGEVKMNLNETIKKLEEIAEGDCECTEDQQTGRDPSMCKHCMAGHALNTLSEDAKWELKELEERKEIVD